jgi:hypothetical protein
MTKAKWYENAFGAAADKVGAAIDDIRTKLIDESWYDKPGTTFLASDPFAERDPFAQAEPGFGIEPTDGLYHLPISPMTYPEAPVQFYDLPTDKPTPPEQDHDIDR